MGAFTPTALEMVSDMGAFTPAAPTVTHFGGAFVLAALEMVSDSGAFAPTAAVGKFGVRVSLLLAGV